jgi:general secretion pathway protein L
MISVGQIAEAFSQWTDCVAVTIVALLRRVTSHREVRVTEGEDGNFVVRSSHGEGSSEPLHLSRGNIGDAASPQLARILRGGQIEFLLKPARFLFQPLELPRRASEFLDGIVKSQIDRLTPWNANDAAFGWTSPTEVANDRIVVMVAATAKALVMPFVKAAAEVGADSITISTRLDDEHSYTGFGAASIKVFEENLRGALEVRRIRRLLRAMVATCALTAVVATGAGAPIVASLATRQEELSHRLAEMRGVIHAGQGDASAVAKLERRKRETPSSVIALEALSQILPDHTYVTELRIEGEKLQIVGLTQDAPSLIRLVEECPQFAQASFFAPTTRSTSQSGEHFHIEAHIRPVYKLDKPCT